MELCVMCNLFMIIILQLFFHDISVVECGRQYDDKQQSRFRRDTGYDKISLSSEGRDPTVADISKAAIANQSTYDVATTKLQTTKRDLTATSLTNTYAHKTIENVAQIKDVHTSTTESFEALKTNTTRTLAVQTSHDSSIQDDDKARISSDAYKISNVSQSSTKQPGSNTSVKPMKPFVKNNNSEISKITNDENIISRDLNSTDSPETALHESKSNANMQTKPTTDETKNIVANPIDSISVKEINSDTIDTNKIDSNSDFSTEFYRGTTKQNPIILKSINVKLHNVKQMESAVTFFTNIPTRTLRNDSHDGGKQTALSGGPAKSNSVDDRSSLPAPALPLTGNTTSSTLTLIATNPLISPESSSFIDTSTLTDTTVSSHAEHSVTSTEIAETSADKTSKTSLTTSQRDTSTGQNLSSVKGGISTTLATVVKTTSKAKSTTTSSDNQNNDKSESKDIKDEKQEKSMFGEYGLPLFIAASAVALCLLIVVIYLLLKKKEDRKQGDFMVGDSTPKLRMLEVRNDSLTSELKTGNKNNKDDDLPTYSLDYEKHVQEKIEEHRKMAKSKNQNLALAGAEPTPLAGVSSFKIARRPSAESGGRGSSRKSRSGSQSGPTSPVTPSSAEGRPLLNKEDDPVVFNFAKKPGEATAAREARRGSTPNTGNKPKSVTKSKDDYFGINV